MRALQTITITLLALFPLPSPALLTTLLAARPFMTSLSSSSSSSVFRGVNLGPTLSPHHTSVASRFATAPALTLVLSSGSSTRRMILDSIPLDYKVHVSPVDERGVGVELREEGSKESARKLVEMLAAIKRGGVLEDLEAGRVEGVEGGCVVLTADQVVTHPDLGILEKPLNLSEASTFMSAYASTPSVTTVGSVMLTHFPSLRSSLRTFEATVLFDGPKLTADLEGEGPNLLDRLVESGAPVMHCAGGLMVENPLVREFVVGVEGGEDAVLGLARTSVLECVEEIMGVV
mmetsp:Transcript_14673/g.29193  ORF Transcript_14673/g.29193 Transcript_14673/m.29193 type:complete len:290 (+) Transcript_14673:23-892(+)